VVEQGNTEIPAHSEPLASIDEVEFARIDVTSARIEHIAAGVLAVLELEVSHDDETDDPLVLALTGAAPASSSRMIRGELGSTCPKKAPSCSKIRTRPSGLPFSSGVQRPSGDDRSSARAAELNAAAIRISSNVNLMCLSNSNHSGGGFTREPMRACG
jgi:hypothetical protein